MKKIGRGIGVILLIASIYGCPEAEMQSVAGEKEHIEVQAPTSLKLVIVPNGFRLTWMLSPQDPGIVTGYEIVRSDVASGPFDTVATVKKGVSEYIDTTASEEMIYFYKIRAKAGYIYSPYSAMVAGERMGRP